MAWEGRLFAKFGKMSRIGKLPIDIPSGVEVKVDRLAVWVKGPKGTLKKDFAPARLAIEVVGSSVLVKPLSTSRTTRAMWGTARSIIASMVEGTSQAFSKKLEIEGVGFRAILRGRRLDLALGYSHPTFYDLPDGVVVEVSKNGTSLLVEGSDKALVGQVAADIKAFYPVEPYKGKGVRIEGQFVYRKEGKKTA